MQLPPELVKVGPVVCPHEACGHTWICSRPIGNMEIKCPKCKRAFEDPSGKFLIESAFK